MALIGGAILLIGGVMLFLPGPGSLVIAGGIALLAPEFIWARRAMRRAKGVGAKVRYSSGLKNWLRQRRAGAAKKPLSEG